MAKRDWLFYCLFGLGVLVCASAVYEMERDVFQDQVKAADSLQKRGAR